MGKKHHQIAKALNETIAFPWHGVARCSDGSAVLIFPFLRATWELHGHNQELTRERKIKWKDVFRSEHFQDRWFRVFHVANKITSLETAILNSDHSFAWMDAHKKLPFWLDLLHFYIPMLLDSMVVALGLIISDAPENFPKKFKTLFKKDKDFKASKLRCDEGALRRALSENRQWYDKIRPPDGKSIRDSIGHRLCKWQITTQGDLDPDADNIVKAQLQGDDSDISTEDGLREAREFLCGLCVFLSALPPETWMKRKFDGRDLITAQEPHYIGGQFLPELPNTLQITG